MPIYLTVFWIIYALFGLLILISFLFKIKKLNKYLQEYSVLVLIIALSFLIIAIITKDPMNIAGYTIPTELQWLGSLLVTGFSAWKFYLNPLKIKVYSMDREIGEVSASVKKVENNVSMILSKLIKK